MSENFRDEEAIKRPKHRLTLLPLALTLGCATTSRDNMKTVLEAYAARQQQEDASVAESEPVEETGKDEDTSYAPQPEEFEATDDFSDAPYLDELLADYPEGATVWDLPEGMKFKIRGEILVPNHFPLNTRLSEQQDKKRVPSAVEVLLPDEYDRKSISYCRLDFVVRDKKTDEVVFRARNGYTHVTIGEVLRRGIPDLPQGEYEVLVTSKTKYLTEEDGYQTEDHEEFLEFIVE